ncbi:unnamed protein product [Cuscuta epithymum]|uniref:RNase H type-1 domain-containing protein n=1 Tax=Cuscuta epithymum TaxID=186058 RepID=A0AAV0FX04_9ASTE|nr:unnamed protein product [Cuscuta epithymum]
MESSTVERPSSCRNMMVWEQKEVIAKGIVAKPKAFLDGWRRAVEGCMKTKQRSNVLASWKRPEVGRLKLNTDASIGDGNICGLGWVVRDSEGRFIAGGVDKWYGSSPKVAEALAIREALSWLKQSGWDYINVESDALQVISSINSGSDGSLSGVIIDDIRDMSTSFTSIYFTHMKRSANRVAHDLARAVVSMCDRYVWLYHFPTCISVSLDHDLINDN